MSVILSFLYYSFVSGITPGPANICSLSTAMRKGKQVTLRQWRGLFAGYFFVSMMSVFMTWIVGAAFGNYVKYFTFIGAIYIIWLTIHILMDSNSKSQDRKSWRFKEGTFMFGFLIQATNVKVIIFCITVFTGYMLPYRRDFISLFLVGIILPFIGPVCNLVWLFTGAKMQKFFESHKKTINIIMSGSLIFCAISMILL